MSLRSWRASSRARRSITVAVVFAVVASLVGLTRASSTAEAADAPPIAQKLAVPSYIHPLADPGAWTRLVQSKPGTVGISMANVLNGPDYEPKPEWAAVIERAHAAGQKVLGYVDSGYFGTTGQRTRAGSVRPQDWTAQIERDVAAWYQFYGPNIDGIFFDQGQNACGPTAGSDEYADLYRDVNRYVKRNHPGALTVINPGTGVPQCYEDTADVLLTFESDYAAYIGQNPNPVLNYKPLDWTPMDPDKIWHLIYAASEAQVADALQKSRERNVGWVYVTDDVMVNPWDTLPAPSYWDLEQSSIATAPPAGATGPTAPVVTVSGTAATSVTLAWQPAAPGSAPVVGYDVLDGGAWIESTRGDATSWTVADLGAGTAHRFTVVARDAVGARSAPSTPVAVATAGTDPSPPTTPAAVTASATDYTTTTVSWSPSTDAEGPVTGYDVQLDGQEVLELPAGATSVLVSELPAAATSTFTVTSRDASGQRSAPSQPVAVTTLALPDGRRIINPSVAETADSISYKADFLVPFSFRRVFISTGVPTDPCWRSNTAQALCVSYLVENGALQKYVGDGTGWGWTKVRDLNPTIDGYSYTWTISPTDIGSPATHQVLFNAEGYAPLTYTDTPITSTAPAPPVPDQWIGGGNPSGFAPCTCNGTEVDPLTGELALVDHDISAPYSPTGELARTLTRTYSSARAATEGRFGAGWIDSYDLRLAVQPNGSVVIRQENGSNVVFGRDADGTYAALPTFDAGLTANPDGTWSFVRKGTATFTFDASGRLAAKAGAGDELTLGYDDEGLLRTVRSRDGEALTFDYIGTLVVRVTDGLGRRVSYGYDARHDLRSVNDDTTRVASYEYDANHLLIKVDTPRNRRAVYYGYDAEARVHTRLNERWHLTIYDYAIDPTTLDGSSTTTSGLWGEVTRSVFQGGNLVSQTYDDGTPFASTVRYENDPTTREVLRMVDPRWLGQRAALRGRPPRLPLVVTPAPRPTGGGGVRGCGARSPR